MFDNGVDFITDILLFRFLGFGLEESETSFLHYFIFQSIRLILLCWFAIFVFSFIRTWISNAQISQWFSKKSNWKSYLLASLIGVIIPFPTGTHIPIVIGLLKSDVPISVVVIFLITAPMLSEFTIVYLNGYFNLIFTLIYVLCVITLSIVSGIILGRFIKSDDICLDFDRHDTDRKSPDFLNFSDRILFSFRESMRLTRKLFIWILLGVAVGGSIERAGTLTWFSTLPLFKPWIGVPLVTLIALPLMLNPVIVIPIASALFDQGLPLGVMIAFMMAITTLSLADSIILRWIIPPKIMLRIFLVAGTGICILGYIFNL